MNTAATSRRSQTLQQAELARPELLPPANFNRLARPYRWMEWLSFGPFLWWSRCFYLPRLRDRQRALVIGDGDGRFTARLLYENPSIHIDAVDASNAMLRALAQRAGKQAHRVQTHCADARKWQPASSGYDLIVTHFFLDCLETAEVLDLAHRLRDATTPDALWVISEFAVPKTLLGRCIAAPMVKLLYWAFALLTGLRIRSLPNHAGALSTAGFTRIDQRRRLAGLLVSELWQRS